jgi:hypothetical protein
VKCYKDINIFRLKSSPPLKGILPYHLSPYVFHKGQRPHNFKYEFCELKDCPNRHLALGLCSKHYQQLKKANEEAK